MVAESATSDSQSSWQEQRWTSLELQNMSERNFEHWKTCWDAGAFRLLGVPYRDYQAAYQDIQTGDFRPGVAMTAYKTIVADPPWPQPSGGGRRANAWSTTKKPSLLPYPTMELDEIELLDVRSCAAQDAHLYLWTTNRFLESAFVVARCWGFEPSCVLVWAKTPRGIGMGGAFTITTEFIIFARRGSLPFREKLDRTWWNWKRGPHSRKPEGFLDIVERVSPGPYLELFARRNRLGWDTWGNEALQHIQIAKDKADWVEEPA